MTPAQQLTKLPPAIQDELLVIARTVIGMDHIEKQGAQLVFGSQAFAVATEGCDELVPAGTVQAAFLQIVKIAAELAGQELSEVRV